jgi:hypothetical protein
METMLSGVEKSLEEFIVFFVLMENLIKQKIKQTRKRNIKIKKIILFRSIL